MRRDRRYYLFLGPVVVAAGLFLAVSVTWIRDGYVILGLASVCMVLVVAAALAFVLVPISRDMFREGLK